MWPGLLKAAGPIVDVVILPAKGRVPIESLACFARVCTLTKAGRPVRVIYARSGLGLARMSLDVTSLNARYNRAYQPRSVPLPLEAGDDLVVKLGRYQTIVRGMKRSRAAGRCEVRARSTAGEIVSANR
jgi:hypothetical protein